MDKHYNIQLIDNYLLVNNLSKKDFCLEINIDMNDLLKIYENNFDVSIICLYKIVNKLNIKASDFLIY